MSSIRMVHVPSMRSVRPVWLYYELKALYGEFIPEIEVTTFTDVPAFRACKPQWLLDINPVGSLRLPGRS